MCDSQKCDRCEEPEKLVKGVMTQSRVEQMRWRLSACQTCEGPTCDKCDETEKPVTGVMTQRKIEMM